MEQKQNVNPVVILVSEQGANLIKAVCNAALKQDGMGALNVTNLILSNMKGLAPPQAQQLVDKKESEEPARTIPFKKEQPEEPKKEG